MQNLNIRHINEEDRKYLEVYLQNLRRLNKSEHTIRNYRADIEKFMLWLKDHKQISIEKINGETISEYKEFMLNGGKVHAELKTKSESWFKKFLSTKFFKRVITKRILFFQDPMSVSSRRRHLSSLKNFFEYLKESHEDTHKNKFAKNPVKNKIHSIRLKDVDVESTKLITKDDFLIIYENCFRTRDRLMLDLLYYGGLRLSELCYLKVTDFDFADKSITFIRKGGSRHKLQIKKADLIFKNFQFYLQNREVQSEYVFSNSKGQHFSLKGIYNQIVKILERNNIDAKTSPHSFRKACATNLYKQTKDLLLVRDYLNHSDAKVTQTYIDTQYIHYQ